MVKVFADLQMILNSISEKRRRFRATSKAQATPPYTETGSDRDEEFDPSDTSELPNAETGGAS